KIVEKIMELISQPVTIREQEFFVTASLGVSIYPADGETVEALMKNADLAMYISKNSGKNKYTICSTDMKENALKKIKLTNALYRAIERNELLLYYQPQVSISTKEIVGVEALIRWNNPEFGMVQPSSFVPLAEKTGLINNIGCWVLRTACMQIKKWQSMGLPLLRISVNISVEQFRDRKLIDTVDKVLKQTGFDAKYLELEITESIAVEGEEHVVKVLHQLKELGILISIDDFGMEYSSLGRLKALPIDQLKIDMRFVQNISKGNSKDEVIVRTIIQLAKNLDLNVIVEGIETEEQFRFFEKENCDEIQGYYFYRPMPALELEKILKNRRKKK
ncbi:MAG: bifunctional diguanylate cyclase/phosphodiesterase, partial [Clostridiaceae bacterium]|nr:bifunctional diguanylate cyclase/phosphodiesterase [Clostridiaceae bacterium]